MRAVDHVPTADRIRREHPGYLQTPRRVARRTPGSLLFVLLFTLSLCAQTPDSNTSWVTTAEFQNSDNLGSMRTSASHTQNGNRTVDTQSLQRLGSDGNFVPYQDIEKETVKVDSSTVRTTTRTFVRNDDGVKTLFQVTDEEKQTSPDGNSKLVRTTSNTGANGDLQLVQRDVQETKKTGTDALDTKTTTYLSGVDGLAPAMKTDELQNRIGAHTLAVQKTTLLPDGTRSWQVGEVRRSTETEEDKSVSSEEHVGRPDRAGKLTEVSRTVRTESETSPGQKREIQDTYSTETPGVASDGKLHLAQRVTTAQQTAPNGEQTTSKQIEQPNPGDPSAGLQVTTSTANTVILGSSGAQATLTISVRDANGSLQAISVDTTRASNVGAVQVKIGPPGKSTPDEAGH